MMIAIFLAIIPVLVASEGCKLPEQLRGHWNSNRGGWNAMTITNTTIRDVRANGHNLPFTCYMQNGSTYILQSEVQEVATVQFNYYTCVDIIPSLSNPDIVFFHVLTERNQMHQNDSVISILSTAEKSFDIICQKNHTQLPIGYNMFFRPDHEASLVNTTCPGILQAEFSANFTTEADYNKCPEGFELNGCDRTHFTFNYTMCGSDTEGHVASGAPNYTCLTTVRDGNVTYTLIFMQQEVSPEQPNHYQFACLAETMKENGELKITKSAGTCGATPSVTMLASETVSCRAPTTAAPEQTTQSGSINTTQNTSSASQGPGTGNGDQGGEGEGEGSSTASQITMSGLFTMLVSALLCVLVAPAL